jgi:NADPH:quinone reductase-like Zn-dependent oxidoreductase
VLIHSAAGATRQLAVQLAHMISAEVFATVRSADKKQILHQIYDTPAHVFYSRSLTIIVGALSITKG